MDLKDYKQAWKNQPDNSYKLSALEIYKMTQSKSTSIAKWIFIIGIIEFSFWFALNFVATKNGIFEPYEELHIMQALDITAYFHYLIIIVFLYVFYKNFSAISAIDNTKTLMHKIIKTRKTVKWYVYYNLFSIVITTIIFNLVIFNTPNALEAIYDIKSVDLAEGQIIAVIIVTQLIMMSIMILILMLFYYLLYGILLKKLNRNYKELIKLETE